MIKVSRKTIKFVDRTVRSPTIRNRKLPELLSNTGRHENWFIEQDEIEIDPQPFAKGTCGQIHMGRVRSLEVCIKQVTNKGSFKDVKDIRREIALWRSLRHPNITLFIGASFVPDRGVQIIMEKMSGGDLKSLVKTGELSTVQALEYAIHVGQALSWLHGNTPPLLHRDLKPENILLDGNGRAKLSDFGLSRLMRKGGPNGYKMTGMTGTLRYMAPEVMRNEAYSVQCDVYSAGLVLYFMLSRSHPFSGFNRATRIAYAEGRNDFQVSPHLGMNKEIAEWIEMCTIDKWQERPCARDYVTRLHEIKDNSKQCCVVA